MNKKITTLLLTCFAYVLSVCAQNISVSAPTHVATGENFRVSYTIANVSVDEFRSASIPSGLEVIAGPYTSQQSSYQIVNGHTSRSSSITYTYTLYAEKAGTYTIGAAHAKAGGKTIASRPFRIQVSGATRNNGSSAPNMHDDAVSPSHSSGGRISSKDLFVKVTANKKHVHEQEPILLTYKVYTLVDLTSLDGKMPDLKGFHTQEIPLPQQKSFHIEKLNGRNYRCVTWSQYVMYPQMTGKMTIPSLTFKGVVVMQNRNVDPFEAFFNGGSGYIEVKRNIVAPAIDIQVDPLPQKPADFSGGVGRFSISSQLLNNTVKAGAPVTLRVVVGGNGNLKLIKQPVVTFPKDFDKYDPKVTDKTKLTTNGLEGNMVYDFLVVPRNQGNYTIPAVSLTYYDTSSNMYKTVKTAPLTIKVEPGDGKGTSVTDYSAVQQTDIKPIKQGGYDTIDTEKLFFGSTSFLLWLLLPFVLFVALVAIFHKKAVENADIVGKRGKRANKVATKRLKTAYKLLTAGKQNEFYDEVLRALWGYGGRLDKHNMVDHVIFSPRANLRYNPTENMNLRASYSFGFRAPQAFDEDLHIENVGGTVSMIELAKDLTEEKSQSLSISGDLYHRWGDFQGNLLIEGFYTSLSDVFALRQKGERDGIIINERYNEKGAKVYGLTLEGKIAYRSLLQLQAGVTMQKAEYKQARAWSDDETVPMEKKMFRTPNTYGYFTLSYNPFVPMTIALSGTYTGSMMVEHKAGFIDKDIAVNTPDFFELNLKAGYDFNLYKGITMQVNAQEGY